MTENIRRFAKSPPRSNPQGGVHDFVAVYTEHRLAIYRYILARVGHDEDAHDITAQVFLKAYQNAGVYRGESSIIFWLIGIARHQVIDYYRRTPNTFSLTDRHDIISPAPSIEDQIDRDAQLKRVSHAINALSKDRREAVSLRLFAGLSNPEIAELMGKQADAYKI
jgi:RNA polymerase sigma-70 factor (ECF subfamily)